MEDLEAFVAARGAPLRRFAYLLSGDRQRAEDLVQSALARVVRAWPRVAAMEHPEAYVRQVVVREHLAWWRRRASTELVSDAPPDRAQGGSDFTTTAAERDAAWQLLATLPPRQRAVLVLRFYEDLDDAAVARVLGTTESTVRSNAARGLAALRRALAAPTTPEEALP